MKRHGNPKLVLGALVLAMAASLTAWQAVPRSHQAEPSPLSDPQLSAEPAPVWEAPAPEADSAAIRWDLPVTRNARVDGWIGFLQGRNGKLTRLWLERSGRYGPMIREQLRARGMPEDLVYLAFIESGFSPHAHSTASAAGIWQFIAETGRRYGLEVSTYVDERRDPIESTRAALDYLQKLHERFGSWYLASAAYNTGENRVERILRERMGVTRGRDEFFWVIAPHLPEETRNYVPLMLAAGHIGKSPAEFGFPDVVYQEPLVYDSVVVADQTSLELIARAANVPVAAVKDLNPHLVRGTTPPSRGWEVRIPKGSAVAFLSTFDSLSRRDYEREKARLAAAKPSVRTHRVRSGETLSHIARKHGVSVNAIVAANRGISARRLPVGRVLTIPGKAASAKPKQSSSKRTTVAKSTTTRSKASSTKRVASKTIAPDKRIHTVRKGETLGEIAHRYRISVSRLQILNGLRQRNVIYPGQKLRVS